MKVSIVQGGGFGGVVTTTVADAGALAPDDADALRAKVAEAGLFDLRAAAPAPRATATAADDQPDRPSYALVVEDGDRRHEVVLNERDLPDAVRSLIAWVESVPGHEEQVGRPGRT